MLIVGASLARFARCPAVIEPTIEVQIIIENEARFALAGQRPRPTPRVLQELAFGQLPCMTLPNAWRKRSLQFLVWCAENCTSHSCRPPRVSKAESMQLLSMQQLSCLRRAANQRCCRSGRRNSITSSRKPKTKACSGLLASIVSQPRVQLGATSAGPTWIKRDDQRQGTPLLCIETAG